MMNLAYNHTKLQQKDVIAIYKIIQFMQLMTIASWKDIAKPLHNPALTPSLKTPNARRKYDD
jgi:hypothetical protein